MSELEKDYGQEVATLQRRDVVGQNPANRNDIYTRAVHALPRADENIWRGKPDHTFTAFMDADNAVIDHQVVVPFRGITTERKAAAELQELTQETLGEEPLQEFYRHTYMLQRFGDPEKVLEHLPTILKRVKDESADFANEAYPDDPIAQAKTQEEFYFVQLACLDRIEDASLELPSEIVESLYADAIDTHPRSIYYALLFDDRNKAAGNGIDVAQQVKRLIEPQLLEPDLPNEQNVIDLVKWSYNNQELQTGLLRESLLKADSTEQVDRVMSRFAAAMEVYDITTYLQEYALDQLDFAPKVAMVFSYLDNNPVQSTELLKRVMAINGDERGVQFADDPIQTDFRTEDHMSAAREVSLREDVQGNEGSFEEILTELNSLSDNQLEHELFRDFYQHMDMLSKFGDATLVAKFLPTIMKRGRIGVNTNYSNLPQNEFSNKRSGLPDALKEQAYLKMMACLEVCEEDPTVRLQLASVKDLAQAARDIDPRFIRYALVFDERNKMYGEDFPHMEKSIIDVCSSYLINADYMVAHRRELVEGYLTWSYVRPEIYSHILVNSLQHISDSNFANKAIRIVQGLAPYMGVEKIRQTLRDYSSSLTDGYSRESFAKKTDAIFDYMQLDVNGPVAVDLVRDVYEQVDMEGYKPNDELLNADVSLIKRELGDAKNIADVACGPGRHFFALDGEDGRHVTGYDLVPKHIDHIKSINPDADVHVGSWFDLDVADKEYEAVVILGRSFAHNTTIFDAVACLQEMKRIIKDDGEILLDLPDGTRGDYSGLIAQTLGRASAQGIDNILPGTIIDSPDGKHYFDRYVPDREAFQALCELAGLNSMVVDETPYHGNGEEVNTNIYWKLTKIPAYERMSIDRVAELIKTIRTNRYPTPEDLPTLDQTTPSSSSRSEGDE